MTFDEWHREILRVIPYAEIGEDNEGQLVIYTGMREIVGASDDGPVYYVEPLPD